MPSHWIAERTKCFDSSGIRKVFDLGAKLAHPINLSIGQPDFDVPDEVRQAAIEAIQNGKNGYALTQGMPVLRDKLQAQIDRQYGHSDRQVFITSGTSGGLMLAMLALVNPGEEVIVFDPYFVMYDALASVAGGKPVYVATYPDFRIDVERVAAAITPRTKAILFNSPANPTGMVASPAEVRDLAQLAAERDIALVSDEIYREFCYDGQFFSPAAVNAQTLVIDGFSKTYGMPGWRVGFAHGPSAVIQQMIKLQQYSFVWPRTRSNGPAQEPSTWTWDRTSTLIGASGTWSWRAWATTTSWSVPAGPSMPFPKSPGAPPRSLSPARSRNTNSSSFPATSSAAATRTSASRMPPRTRSLSRGWTCCGKWRSDSPAIRGMAPTRITA